MTAAGRGEGTVVAKGSVREEANMPHRSETKPKVTRSGHATISTSLTCVRHTNTHAHTYTYAHREGGSEKGASGVCGVC